MPRANRHRLPGHVWHVTHRCHCQQFLLKFTVTWNLISLMNQYKF